jgi:hypothetical protein
MTVSEIFEFTMPGKSCPRFQVGDVVRPRPEWRAPHLWGGRPCGIPSGPVRAVVPWGAGVALYVGDDHRAFVADVFELVPAVVTRAPTPAGPQPAH